MPDPSKPSKARLLHPPAPAGPAPAPPPPAPAPRPPPSWHSSLLVSRVRLSGPRSAQVLGGSSSRNSSRSSISTCSSASTAATATTTTTTTTTTTPEKTLARPRSAADTDTTNTSTAKAAHPPSHAPNPDAAHPPTATPARKMSNVVLGRPLGVYYARGFSSLSSFSSLFRLKTRLPNSSTSSSTNSSSSHVAKQQLHDQAAVGFRANTHCRFKSVTPLSPPGGGASSASTSTTAVSCAEEELADETAAARKVPPRAVVKIVEVGARDGLQNEQGVVSTETKIELIERLSGAGLRHIEAGSFVSPKWVPQMADTPQIHTHLNSRPPAAPAPVTYSYLTPNMKGLTSYLATPAPPARSQQQHTSEIAVFASASEGFSRQNINCSIAESLERFRPVVEGARKQGVAVRGYVSMVIECPYDGPTPPERVAGVVEKLLAMGCYEVSLGDTNGVGTPGTIGALMNYLIKERRLPAEKMAAHFHDTYGQAIVNCLVALEAGIRTFDSSVAGLGGCPYSKGATGNVATEDLVYFLEGTGVSTNVDLQKIVEIGDWISGVLGRRNDSKVGTALMARRRAAAAAKLAEKGEALASA